MLPVSARFLRATRESHDMVMKAEIIAVGGDVIAPVVVTGGSTIFDVDAQITIGGTLEAVDELSELVPTGNQDKLSPFLSEVQISRGIQFAPDDIEWCLLGLLRVKKLGIGAADGVVTLSCETYDRSIQVQRKMGRMYPIEGGKIETVIPPLISRQLPNATFELPVTRFEVPPLLLAASDETWASAQSIANSMGFTVRVTRPGTFRIEPAYRGAAGSRIDFIEGVNADFFDVERGIDSDGIPNVIIVQGTHPNAPGIQVEVGDIDPSSPTYRYGPYGEQVEIIESEKIVDQEQALEAGLAVLAARLGIADVVEFNAIPNAALDLNDVVYVTRERLGIVNRPMRVARIDMPHRADELMHVTARRSLVLIEDVIRAQQSFGV